MVAMRFARCSRRFAQALLCALLLSFTGLASGDLPDLIDQVKPSIVVVGTYVKTRSPSFIMRGTGFAVGNGALIATNAHVVPEVLDAANG